MGIIKDKTIQHLIERIEKVEKEKQPLWGKMTSTQMLAHCSASIKMAYGDFPVKLRLTPFKSAIWKFLIVDLLPFRKHLPAPPEINVGKKLRNIGDFETEKQQLIVQLNRMKDTPSDYDFSPHPIFRKMGPRSWGRIAVKHLDHHLRQFGV